MITILVKLVELNNKDNSDCDNDKCVNNDNMTTYRQTETVAKMVMMVISMVTMVKVKIMRSVVMWFNGNDGNGNGDDGTVCNGNR